MISDKIGKASVNGSLFYLVMPVNDLDGTIDFDGDAAEAFASEVDAVEHAREQVEEFGGEAIVYTVRAVTKCIRPAARLVQIKPR